VFLYMTQTRVDILHYIVGCWLWVGLGLQDQSNYRGITQYPA
jgi:hypothetical protein